MCMCTHVGVYICVCVCLCVSISACCSLFVIQHAIIRITFIIGIFIQITNLYGATNDEYSQPRHCWDPSGKYIYGVSVDRFA